MAAFLVCYWHFVHLNVSTAYVPSFFLLSWLEEGHTGVALFMTLSGYLFMRLVNRRRINVRAFALNRVLRLAPLLLVVFCLYLVSGESNWKEIAYGFVLPTWPAGAWSIAAELHFYLLFPLLLVLVRHRGVLPLGVLIAAAILFRLTLWFVRGEVQSLAYWTIVGRIDQFLWGMLLAVLVNDGLFKRMKKRQVTLAALVISLTFLAVWHQFNLLGGFYFLPTYPSPSPIWILLPSLEGAAYAVLIAWYSETDFQIPTRLDRLFAVVGAASFSIYIWHWPLRFPIRNLFQQFGFEPGHFVSASVAAVAFFGCVAFLGFISYRLIERPFLGLRINYLQ